MSGTEISHEAAVERWRDRITVQTAKAGPPKERERPSQPPIEHPRTVSEAAKELALSVHTVRAWVAARRIAHIRLGRVIRIPASEIRRLIEENTVPAIKER
jgi:excisionase family DNA binding protein